MKSIGVYLGARSGADSSFSQAAIALGREIARRGFRLVYGGSSHGLMGCLANAALDAGGEVVGIMPRCLIAVEQPIETLDELVITDTMQERKLLMQQMSDGFIAMPGGVGTLEEVFETWSAIKIGVYEKSLGFLNTQGFYNGLFLFMEHCEQQGFVSKKQVQLPYIEKTPEALLNALCPEHVPKEKSLA